MTDTITVHSLGLCVQLLNKGPEQRADIPLERKAEKVNDLMKQKRYTACLTLVQHPLRLSTFAGVTSQKS